MTSIYLSSTNPRWTPKTEADLDSAISAGLLEESHYLDLKESLVSKSDNRETARDLASFAIDGGTLIIGIAEDKTNRTFMLAPQPLAGMAEKVEQVARSIPDPPLSILTETITSEADQTTGYLVVDVPASPAAPHMVDGRYFGRGDKTKHSLSDPEVVRLHDQRRAARRDALDLLQHEIANDPVPTRFREQAHLFLVAQPLAGRRDMLLGLTGTPQWNVKTAGFMERAFTPEVNSALFNIDASPTLADADNGYRRSRGVARATANLGEGRILSVSEGALNPEDAIELQIHTDGGLRLFLSRFSDKLGRDNEQQIIDAAAVSNTRRFLALVLAAAEEAGYFGNWALAVGATYLSGLRAYSPPQTGFGFAATARYEEHDYRETTEVSWAELNVAPGAVARRLLGPLLMALSVESRYTKALSDPEPPPAGQQSAR